MENLLSLTRLDDETLRLNRQYLEVEEAVEQALFHTAAQRRQHPVEVDVAPDCAGSFDGQLLVQMFVNLIGNTVAHTPKGTTLRIQGTRDQDRVILDVCDNGPGVCQQVREHLFEPFVPKSSTISDSYRSMGLGLSLVHSIVLAHQGSIEYRDGHPGACFHIELPCSGETDETIDTECGR